MDDLGRYHRLSGRIALYLLSLIFPITLRLGCKSRVYSDALVYAGLRTGFSVCERFNLAIIILNESNLSHLTSLFSDGRWSETAPFRQDKFRLLAL